MNAVSLVSSPLYHERGAQGVPLPPLSTSTAHTHPEESRRENVLVGDAGLGVAPHQHLQCTVLGGGVCCCATSAQSGSAGEYIHDDVKLPQSQPHQHLLGRYKSEENGYRVVPWHHLEHGCECAAAPLARRLSLEERFLDEGLEDTGLVERVGPVHASRLRCKNMKMGSA